MNDFFKLDEGLSVNLNSIQPVADDFFTDGQLEQFARIDHQHPLSESLRSKLLGRASGVGTLPPAAEHPQEIWITDSNRIYFSDGTKWILIAPNALGCHVYRNVNEALLGTAQFQTITWTTATLNSDFLPGGWAGGASLTVPADAGGIYVIETGVLTTAVVTGVTAIIRLNGTAIGSSDTTYSATNSAYASKTYALSAGDVITAGVYNSTAGNIQVQGYVGSTITPRLPYLSLWRL